MIRYVQLATFFFISIIIFISCNQDPASVPSELVPDEDKVEYAIFDSQELNVNQSSGFFAKLENLYGGDTRLLGKNEYAKSSILLGWDFYFPDSIKTFINDNQLTVSSAQVKMIPIYHLGDVNNHFDFTANQITSDWNVTEVHRDTLQFITHNGEELASSKTYTDSTLNFNLNTNVVMSWLKYVADTNSTPKNYGIILKPTESTNRFMGFKSTYSTTDSVQTIITIVLQKSSVPYDTLTLLPSKELHVVENISTPQPSRNKIYLEGGYALRGNLFIDISSLPKNVGINKAILEIPVDSINTIDGEPSSDSLIVHIIKDSTTRALTSDSMVTTLLKRSGNKFTGNITWIVQRWVNGTENHGLQLTLYDEYSSTARIVLYGSKETNSALRPRLIIYYPKRI